MEIFVHKSQLMYRIGTKVKIIKKKMHIKKENQENFSVKVRLDLDYDK